MNSVKEPKKGEEQEGFSPSWSEESCVNRILSPDEKLKHTPGRMVNKSQSLRVATWNVRAMTANSQPTESHYFKRRKSANRRENPHGLAALVCCKLNKLQIHLAAFSETRISQKIKLHPALTAVSPRNVSIRLLLKKK